MITETLKPFYNEENDIWGYPQEYKKIKFYPIKMKDTHIKDIFYEVFCVPKKYIQNADILRMSYLKFAISIGVVSNKDKPEIFLDKLVAYFSYVTKIDIKDISIGYSGTDYNNIKWHIMLNDTKITESDFEILREMMLVQNGLSLRFIEDYDPDLEKKLMLKNKTSGTMTLKDQVFVFCSLLNKTISEVEEYTLFQFKYQLMKLTAIQEYVLYKPLEASGQIKFTDGSKIKSYFSETENIGRYDDILIHKETFMKESSLMNDKMVGQSSYK